MSVCRTLGRLRREASCCASVDLPVCISSARSEHTTDAFRKASRGQCTLAAWHKAAALATAPREPAGQHACARHAADEDDERPALLEEAGDHLVALHVCVVVAARAHYAKQYRLQVVLQSRVVKTVFRAL